MALKQPELFTSTSAAAMKRFYPTNLEPKRFANVGGGPLRRQRVTRLDPSSARRAGVGQPEQAGEGGTAEPEPGRRPQGDAPGRRGPAPVTAGQPVRRHPLG